MDDLPPLRKPVKSRTMRSRWLAVLGALVLVTLVTCGFVFQQQASAASSHISIDGISNAMPGSAAPRKGGVSHIVMFSFKESTSAAARNKASKELVELKDKCRHPITEKPYIRSIRGGMNVSPQGLNSGVTHAFVVEFDSPEHRDYYIAEDPVHMDFLEDLKPFVDHSKIVVEFTDGKYT